MDSKNALEEKYLLLLLVFLIPALLVLAYGINMLYFYCSKKNAENAVGLIKKLGKK